MEIRLLKKSARIVSWFLAVLFVVGLWPMQAQAALPGARSYINDVAGTGFGDVYLGGNYIQFGVAANGSSGGVATSVATANAALPGGATAFYARQAGNYMGFLGDADGFGVGKDLRIDYFLPGSPTEGWAAGYNDGANNSQYNNHSATGIAGYAFTNTSSGNTLQATGTGIYNAALTIDQVISFDVNSKAVSYDITLTNNTGSTMNNVRFLRQVDPDNTVDFGGSYVTITTVENQGGVGQNAILEAKSLAGDAYETLAGSQAVLQYFSADSRARVFFGSNYDPYNAVYDTPPTTGATVTGDGTGNMVIWFEETNLAAGASTTFTYYAVMRATGGVVSTDPDTDYVFSENDFQFQPPNESLTTVRIKTIPAVGTLYLDANSNGAVDGGETATADQDILVASLTQLKFKPAAGATETSNYDSFTFQVNGDTTSTYDMTVGIVITVPDAPAIGAATPGDGSASIAFTPPAYDGGAAITSYTASCTGGAATPGTGASSPLTVTGMTNGTTYSCSVTATNAKGTSTPSGIVSVTPALLLTYTVTPSAGAGGSISPDIAQTVNDGETAAFTVTPDAGYTASVGGTCGGSLVGSTYTTNAVNANCTVVASFALNSYTVTASAGTGGSISPASASVNHGSTTAFTITPDTGYSIDSVDGTCGGSLVGSTYTTNAVTANCTVVVTFASNVPTTLTSGGALDGLSLLLGGLLLALSRRRPLATLLLVLPLTVAANNELLTETSSELTTETKSDWYIGGQWGQVTGGADTGEVNDQLANAGISATAQVDDTTRNAWRIFGGHRLTHMLAIEGGVTDLGDVTTSLTGGTVSLDQLEAIGPASGKGIELAVVGNYSINEWISGFGRLGLWRWEASYELNGTASGSSTNQGADILFGFGAEARFDSVWSARLSVDRYRLDGENHDLIGLAAVYRFEAR